MTANQAVNGRKGIYGKFCHIIRVFWYMSDNDSFVPPA